MADTVNVDTLEQMVRDGLLFQNARAGTALSDLAARARERDDALGAMGAADNAVVERADAAEADRDRLARRVAKLEAGRDAALTLLHGIDYDEDSRIDRAVRALEGEADASLPTLAEIDGREERENMNPLDFGGEC